MKEAPRVRVAVLFGGQSSEHVISCATAAGVLTAIDRDKFDVIPIGITRTGQWVLVADDPQRLRISSDGEPSVDPGDGPQVLLPMDGGAGLVQVDPHAPIDPDLLRPVDVVLPLLHGPFGEDGTVQGLLELAGLPYVGSGVFASAAGMDKQHMKSVLRSAGMPMGPYEVISPRQWQTDPQAALERVTQLGFPLFVKPCRAGSSIGISKVSAHEQLDEAIALAQQHDPKIIVEAAIAGRELEVAVLQSQDGSDPRTTAPGEIEVLGQAEFYDYQAKYFDAGASELTWPATVPTQVSGQAQELAAAAFDALGCEGLARVDLFYTTTGELLVNEINTMPGFTPISMYPMMWERSGMPYPDLISELIELALNRATGLR